MVIPSTGSVVLVPFPFSNLAQSKLRPAVVLASAERGDWVPCQLTSNPYGDVRAVALDQAEFTAGEPRVVSYARAAKPFTAHGSLFTVDAGRLHRASLRRIIKAVVAALG